MPEEVAFVEPKTDGMTFKAQLKGSWTEIQKRLADVQTISVQALANQLNLSRVESRDMQNRPFLLNVMELKADRLEISYTIPIDSGPKIRRINVIKQALGVLSLISDLYSVDNAELFQFLDSAIDELTGSLSQNYSSLFNSYDAIFNEYKEYKKLNMELTSSNKNLTVQASQLLEQNKALSERLKELEAYSDDSLMVMVQEWLEAHSNEIDISEFGKTYKVNPTRVEQILNRMVSLGYIALKG